MRKTLLILLALSVSSACVTPKQKRERAEAEAVVASASAAVSRARAAGAESFAAAQLRSAENDLRAARENLEQGRLAEATRRARLAVVVADDAAEDARSRSKSKEPRPAIKPKERRK